MKKRIKHFLIIFVALTLAIVFSGTSLAAVTAVREPQANGQNKNNWCWATAAKIVAEHNKGTNLSSAAQVLTNQDGLHSNGNVPYYGVNANGQTTANGVQRSVVVHCKGNDEDSMGYNTDKVAALQYISSSQASVGTYRTPGTTLNSAQMTTLRNDLNNGYYSICNMTYSANSGNGHSAAIMQYRASDGKYRIYDPFDMSDMYYLERVFTGYYFIVGSNLGRIEWIQYCR